MTKHFSFSTDLIFFLFFSFLFLFNIFLIHLLFRKNLPVHRWKKVSTRCSDRNKQFFSLALLQICFSVLCQHVHRPRQITFLVMYVHIFMFYIIYLLMYSHIKIFVCAFLMNTSHRV